MANSESSRILISPKVSDAKIQDRLNEIAEVSGWFQEAQIQVKNGVVILSGQVSSAEHLEWLKEISFKTEGVTAFINKSEMALEGSTISATTREFQAIQQKAEGALPYMVSSVIILFVTIVLAFFMSWFAQKVVFKRIDNFFLKKTLARVFTIPFIAIGLYLAFKVSGLTQLAITVLGGTGLIGLGLGFALKNIFENYFSSMVLSLRRQFNKGDLIEIDGHKGVIQSVTTQGTTLMDYDGNNILIPNSLFFSNIVKNYTLNPNMRLSFIAGIGYDDNILDAQAVILKTLINLDNVVLKKPEPTIAVDKLAAATVNIRVYFWIDYSSISDVKALSVVQKKVKEALLNAGISLPDDAREIVFISPLEIHRSHSDQTKTTTISPEAVASVDSEMKKQIEQNVTNELTNIKEQAQALEKELRASEEGASNIT